MVNLRAAVVEPERVTAAMARAEPGRAAADRSPPRQLLLIAGGTVLAMSTWFAASATAPALRAELHLSTASATLLTSAVQLGFVAGAVASAALSLPDVLHPPRLAALGSLAAAAGTAALPLLAGGMLGATLLRFTTGAALALVYPIGLKLAVSWFSARRGLAVGALVGALTVGSMLPQLIGGSFGSAWRPVLLVSAALSALAAALFRVVGVGPHVDASAPFHGAAVLAIVRQRPARLAVLGYLGHMWELYAVWVWLPTFFAAGLIERGITVGHGVVGAVSFTALGLCGAAGCLAAGWAGDRIGRSRSAVLAMLVSGSCCLLAAATFGWHPMLVVPVLMLWGAAVIADSAMFSACLAAVVDRRYVGTALTAQTALGFLLTVVTIQGLPVIASGAGWPAAVSLLAVGPFLGALAMIRLTPILEQASYPSQRPAR